MCQSAKRSMCYNKLSFNERHQSVNVSMVSMFSIAAICVCVYMCLSTCVSTWPSHLVYNVPILSVVFKCLFACVTYSYVTICLFIRVYLTMCLCLVTSLYLFISLTMSKCVNLWKCLCVKINLCQCVYVPMFLSLCVYKMLRSISPYVTIWLCGLLSMCMYQCIILSIGQCVYGPYLRNF